MAPKAAGPKPPRSQTLSSNDPPKPSLEELFLSLDRFVHANDYTEIVKVADQILSASPADRDALFCKIVALIQDDKIDDALYCINSSLDSNSPSFTFHKAYCLYKKNSLREALLALQGLERNDEVLQLEAQIFYRIGDFKASIESYNKLTEKVNIDSSEIKTNLIASYISGGRSNEVSALMQSLKVSPRSSFELAYNAACALIEDNNYPKAEELLLLARRIGQEMLIEEEYTNDEIENELAPISVQIAFVQQAQGRNVEALEAYNRMLNQKLVDAPSMAVASNNLVVLRRNKDISDSLKKLDNLFEKKTSEKGLQFVENLEHKLSAKQKEAIAFNRFLLLLLGNKLDQVRELVPDLSSRFSNSSTPPILSAALLVREGKLTRAEETLGQYLEKHPNDVTVLYLAHAQVAVLAGHHMVAAQSLEKILELQHKPGMVATLVALKERSGDIHGAESSLDAAVQWWENHMGENKETLELLAKEAAAFKLKHKNMQGASVLFEKLTKSSDKAVRSEAVTGVVSSTAYTDIGKAEEYEKLLPPLPGMAGINVGTLEEKGIAGAPVVGAKRQWAVEDSTIEGRHKSKRRRKRRPRYPKGFDPANPGPPPDPERWLPLRSRSTYRPKRKDKRAQLRGAQGSVARTAPTATSNGSSATSSKPSQSSSKPSQTSNAESLKVPSSSKSRKKFRK